jgi:hypothetical protein
MGKEIHGTEFPTGRITDSRNFKEMKNGTQKLRSFPERRRDLPISTPPPLPRPNQVGESEVGWP